MWSLLYLLFKAIFMQITIRSKLSNYTLTIQSLSFFHRFHNTNSLSTSTSTSTSTPSSSSSSSLFFRLNPTAATQSQEMKNPTNKTIPHKGGVIITVYVESPQNQNNNSHQNPNPLKNINPNAPSESRGYDRRAQLLAYSRELRNADSSTTQLPKTKPKKWKWKVKSETPAVRRLPSRRALQRWRYERVGMMKEERTEVVDQRCLPKCFNGSNKKSTGKSGSSIFKKLKSLLGQLSKGCKRGGDD